MIIPNSDESFDDQPTALMDEQDAPQEPQKQPPLGVAQELISVPSQASQAVQKEAQPVLSDVEASELRYREYRHAQTMQMLDHFSPRNADKTSEAIELADRYALDLSYVEANQEELSRKWRMEKTQDALIQSPVLAEFYTNPRFAAVAHDDADNLSLTEKIISGFKSIPTDIAQGYESGRTQVAIGMVRNQQQLQGMKLTDEQQAYLGALKSRDAEINEPGGMFKETARIIGQMSKTIPNAVETGLATGLVTGVAGATVTAPLGGSGSVLTFGPGFGAGFSTQMMMDSYRFESGLALDEFLESGMDEDVANKAAHAVGVINATLEIAGVRVFTKAASPVVKRLVSAGFKKALVKQTKKEALKGAAKNFASTYAKEISIEVMQEGTNIIAGDIARVLSDDVGRFETPAGRDAIVEQIAGIVEQSTKGMFLLSALPAGAQFSFDAYQANKAINDGEFLSSLMQNAEKSKLNQREKNAYQEFIGRQVKDSDAGTIYVDAGLFQTALESSGLSRQDIANISPEIAAQIDSAQIDSDITIPTEVFVTHFSGTQFGNSLKNEIRLSKDAMSVTEAVKFQNNLDRIAEDAKKVAEEQDAVNSEFSASANVVRDNVFNRLKATGVYSDAVSGLFSDFVRNFVVVNAADIGITPEEFFKRYPYRILSDQQAATTGAAGLNQFAGPRAASADKSALETARARLAAGADAETIRRETGWFLGNDAKWRFEISDQDAGFVESPKVDEYLAKAFTKKSGLSAKQKKQLRELRADYESASADLFAIADRKSEEFDSAFEKRSAISDKIRALEKLSRGEFTELGDILSHKALFEAYPNMMGIKISLSVDPDMTNDSEGYYDSKTNQFSITSKTRDLMLSSVLHEIQHAIQNVEGFARGGSPEGMRGYSLEQSRAALEAKYSDLPSYKKAKENGTLEEWVRDAVRATGIGISPYDAYTRLAGEVEARNTQARQSMTDAERQETAPSQTADKADSDVIVSFNGVDMLRAPRPANAQSANFRVPPPKKLYRGVAKGLQEDGSEGLGTFMLGKGLYSSPSKKFAGQYGEVSEVSAEDAFPRNPLVLNVRPGSSAPDAFRDWLIRDRGFKNVREFGSAYPDPGKYVRSLGYDGVVAGDEVVKYADDALNQSAPFDGQEYAKTPLPEGATEIDVDGVQLPAMNSNGRPIHPTVEGVRNFWRWFGDSKVVDEQGRPLVVYHGTQTPEGLTSFSPGGRDGSVLSGDAYGVASYFTSSPSEASFYARERGAVLPVYIRGDILDVDGELTKEQSARITKLANDVMLPSDKARFAIGRKTREFAEVQDARDFFDNQRANWKQFGDGMERAKPEARADNGKYQVEYTDFDARIEIKSGADAFTLFRAVGFDNLPAAGFDGLMMRREGGQTWVVMHRPDGNVKSATGNSGEFSPAEKSFLRQSGRGGFDPTTLTTLLYAKTANGKQKSDYSTFLHETGHFFLTVTADLASQPNATDRMKADMKTLLDWFGVEDLDTWNAMPLDQQRKYHEQFAYNFELYLFEGKSPNIEMEGLFRRFSAFLRRTYRSIRDELNLAYRSENGTDLPLLTADVRQVMDRMLAAEDQIAEAEQIRNMQPIFQSQEQSGMDDAAWAEYKKAMQDAKDSAIEELTRNSLREMKWLSGAQSAIVKRIQKAASDARKSMIQAVSQQVNSEPVYRAMAFFKKGTIDGKKHSYPNKLSAYEIDAMYEGNPILGLIKKTLGSGKYGMMGKENIIHPEQAAEMFGFSSADEMIRELISAKPIKERVKELTDLRMLEENSEFSDPAALESAVSEALHNEARARFVAVELRFLSKAMSPVRVLNEAAKVAAEGILSQKRVRDIRPRDHVIAEARAAKLALKEMKENRPDKVIRHKHAQLVQNHLARLSAESLRSIEKDRKYLSKIGKQFAKMDANYVDQIIGLLEGYDLSSSPSLKTIDKRESLLRWYEKQKEEGLDPPIPEKVLSEAGRTSYKNLTLEEFRDVVATIKMIEHLGKTAKQLKASSDKRDFDLIADQVSARIRETGGKERAFEIEPSKIKQTLEGIHAAHRRIESLFRQFDGGDDGPMYRALGRSLTERGTMELLMHERATMRLMEIFAPILKMSGGVTGDKRLVPSLGVSLSRGNRIALALNCGNTINRKRIRDGYGWSDQQIDAALSTMTREELTAVNQIWEFLGEFWPDIVAKMRRLYGVAAEKVEAVPFRVKIADGSVVEMSGGYYPIVYDPLKSDRAENLEAAQNAKDIMRGAFVRNVTRHGFEEQRAKEVKNRPVKLSLDVITQHIREVVHDLSFHEWLLDANKLIGDKRVNDAIRAHYSPATIKALKSALEAIAGGELKNSSIIDSLLLTARARVTSSMMFFSVTTALMQPFGITSSIARMGGLREGGKWVFVGAMRWAGDTSRLESTVEWVYSKSNLMRLRYKTLNRDMYEIMGRVVYGKSKARLMFNKAGFFFIQRMQLIVDIPTWVGAYEKAMSEVPDEARAIALADQVVVDSQGAGQIHNLSRVQRDHPMLAMFYGYYNAVYNLLTESIARTDFKNPSAVAGFISDVVLLIVIPANGPDLLLSLLRGDNHDDDDWEDWAKRLAGWQLSYAMNMVVGLREFSGLVSGYDYTGPPVARVVVKTGAMKKRIERGEIDEAAIITAIELIGVTYGLPSTQLIRSWRGWHAWDEDGAPATSVLVGPPRRE